MAAQPPVSDLLIPSLVSYFPKTDIKSPFAARWSFLIAGITYGSVRLSALNRKEKKRLDELERTRPEREAKQKAAALKKQRDEERELAKSAGVEIPPET